MKRSVYDILRRAFDNTVTNWQLLLIRLGETFVFVAISIAAALAILVPMLISIGIELSTIRSPEDFEGVLVGLFENWVLLLWIGAAVFILLGIFIAIHSFVEAGCAHVYALAEQAAGAESEGRPARFRAFSMERWSSGGTEGWWTLFWIYNLGWGVACLFLLIPLIPTILLMTILRGENDGAAIAVGCLGLIAALMVGFVVTIVGAIWVNRAIAVWAVRRAGARDALETAWRAVRTDFGRHLLVALAAFGVAFAGSMFFSSISYFAAFAEMIGRDAVSPFFTFPLRMLGSFLNAAFSGAVGSWFLAAYVSLASESKPVAR